MESSGRQENASIQHLGSVSLVSQSALFLVPTLGSPMAGPDAYTDQR